MVYRRRLVQSITLRYSVPVSPHRLHLAACDEDDPDDRYFVCYSSCPHIIRCSSSSGRCTVYRAMYRCQLHGVSRKELLILRLRIPNCVLLGLAERIASLILLTHPVDREHDNEDYDEKCEHRAADDTCRKAQRY